MHKTESGQCVFELDKNNNLIIDSYNYKFKTIIENNEENYNKLINSETIRKCCKNTSPSNGRITLEVDGNIENYFLLAFPFIKKSKIYVLLSNCDGLLKYDRRNFDMLSAREKEVMNYIVEGSTNKYIAFKLNITEGTIKKTVYNIYKKLGIVSRVELMRLFFDL